LRKRGLPDGKGPDPDTFTRDFKDIQRQHNLDDRQLGSQRPA
jgi:hypothetical protein